jgi:hypothetical protein
MSINIKSNWSVYGCIILAFLLIFAVGIAGYFYQKSQQPAQVAAGKAILKNAAQAPIDTFLDKKGNFHTEIAANGNTIAQATLKDTSVKRDSVIKKVTDDLGLADPTKILEVTQENMQLRDAVLRLRRDSTNMALLAYHDPVLSFQYDPRDSTVRNFLINLHLNQVKYNKTKWFSNTPVYDFYADDPRVRFSGFSHFVVAIPPPLFGLTTDAKTTFNFSNGHFTPSIGLNFRAGKLYLEGREFLFYKDEQVRQSQLVSFGYRQTIF